MHCHSGLTGAGGSLNDQVMLRLLANHFILLLLDRCDDLPQNRPLISGKIFGQELIVCHNIRIIKIPEAVIFYLIGALT